MSRIVVGFDGSPAARAAMTWARMEARLRRVDLGVLVVVGSHGGDTRPVGSDLSTQAVVQDAQEIGGAEATVTVVSGKPADELVRACTQDDLLTVGTRGHSTVVALVIGSTSRACLHHAPCPVVVVRPGDDVDFTHLHHRVIVGVDGSELARQALHVGAEEARLRGAALQAMNVVNWDLIGAELVEPTTRQLVTWGKQLVEKELSESGVTARTVVIHGHPQQVLVRHSAQADLLVLGSRGHSTIGGFMVGSTSMFCAQHAECPVLVIRPQR